MKEWYFTTASNHPGGSGYWRVVAEDEDQARDKMNERFGPRWAFQYDNLEDIHHLDRKYHGTIE